MAKTTTKRTPRKKGKAAPATAMSDTAATVEMASTAGGAVSDRDALLMRVDAEYQEFRQTSERLFAGLTGRGDAASSLTNKKVAQRARKFFRWDGPSHQIVRMWTDYSIGNGIVAHKAEEEGKQDTLDAFWEHPANRLQLSSFGQRRNSDRTLVDGNLYYALFVTNGVVKVRVIDSLQMVGTISNPEDSDEVWLYVRETVDKAQKKTTWLYLSLDAFREKNVTVTEDTTLAENAHAVNVAEDGTVKVTHGSKVRFTEKAAVYHLMFNAVGFDSTGLSVLAGCMDWAFLFLKFMKARSAIQQARAQFITKTAIKGGPTDVANFVAARDSTITATDRTDTNPPHAYGSEEVHNQAVAPVEIKQETGGGDAIKDGGQLLQACGLYAGIFPIYLGAGESFRLATATAMVGPMIRMFSAYQKLLTDTYALISEFALEQSAGSDTGSNNVTILAAPVEEEEAAERLKAVAAAATALGLQGDEQVRRLTLTLMGVENPDDVEAEATEDDDEPGMSSAEGYLAMRESVQALTQTLRAKNEPDSAPDDETGAADGDQEETDDA